MVPFLGSYYNTGSYTGPNLGDPKRDHDFDSSLYEILYPIGGYNLPRNSIVSPSKMPLTCYRAPLCFLCTMPVTPATYVVQIEWLDDQSKPEALNPKP